MRILIALLLCGKLLPACLCQDTLTIYGPQQASVCDTYVYCVETTMQLEYVEWNVQYVGGFYSFQPLNSNCIEILFQYPGYYDIIVNAYGLNGQQFDAWLTVMVTGGIGQANVLGCYEKKPNDNCYKVCAGSKTIIHDPSLINEWEITGAESYQSLDSGLLEITWGHAGMGSVYNLGWCFQDLCFEILPEAQSEFTSIPALINDTIVICKDQEINFINQSFGALSYEWDFGNETVSDEVNPIVTYKEEGYYTITLKAKSICACSDEKSIVVHVLPSPVPELDCVNSICPGTRQRYTATTDGCTEYHWNISANGTVINGGGTADDFIEVIWHEGPDGFIELTVAGCNTSYCNYTNVFRIPVVTPDGPITGDESVCNGEEVAYSAPFYPGTTYKWTMGSYGYISTSKFTEKLKVKWNTVSSVKTSWVAVDYENCLLDCKGTDTIYVSITPEIIISGDDQVCQNGEARVEAFAAFNTPVNASAQWHVEDENGTIVFSQPGLQHEFSYNFTGMPGIYYWVANNDPSSYCNKQVKKRIVVTELPAVPINIKGDTVICPGQSYGFTIENAGNFATLWTITDGTNIYHQTGQSIVTFFGTTPPYTIEASHFDLQYPACKSGSIALDLHPLADYIIEGPDEGCFNGIDHVEVPYSSGVDYTWEIIPADHGVIRKSNLNEAEIFWTKAGNAIVRVTACGISIDKNVLVHPPLTIALLGPLAACANETVTIQTDQPSLQHTWKNEAGNVISVSNQVNLYPGSYAVEIRNAVGCVQDSFFTITTYPAPEVRISCTEDNVYCTTIPGGVDLIANTDGVDYTFLWYRDGVSTGVTGPVFNVTDFAKYFVEVTNQYGCKTRSAEVEFFNCCPVTSCGGGGGLPGSCIFPEYVFAADKIAPECNVHELIPQDPNIIPGETRWYIRNIEGNIGFQHSDHFNYTYSLPGYYLVIATFQLTGFTYTATFCGHSNIIKDTVRAVADFEHLGACMNASIAFEDLSTFLPTETIAAWEWEFDDPASGADNFSNLQHPTHIFSNAGIFDVTLTITMASGCKTHMTKQVLISSGPLLTPGYEPVFCEDEALVMMLPGEVFDVTWDFGDPGSGIQNEAFSTEVFHTYPSQNFYTAKVSASDIYGCITETSMLIDIRTNLLSGNIDIDPSNVLCFGDSATLTAPTGGVVWQWNNDSVDEQIHVAETGQYDVLMEDGLHCTYSPPPALVVFQPQPDLVIRAREIYPSGEFDPWQDGLHICAGIEFELSGFSSITSANYQWYNGSTSQVIQFTDEGGNLPGAGLHEFTLLVINPITGCISDTASILVEVFDLPITPIIALISGSGCSHSPNTLEVINAEPGIQYVWSNGQTGTPILTSEEGLFSVEAIDVNGCRDQSNEVEIKEAADIDLIPGGCYLACDTLTICLPDLDNIDGWYIYKDGNIIGGGAGWGDEYEIKTSGSYVFEITTLNGCVVSSYPLSVQFYPGVGSITVLSYMDVDQDGVISAADTLLPGIPIHIISQTGTEEGETHTDETGGFVFEDYPSTNYLANFNLDLLSSQYVVVIDSVNATIVTCDDSIVVALLLKENCVVTGPDLTFESCPGENVIVGDSIWNDTGSYELHLLSSGGCDSLVNVHINRPDSFFMQVTVWIDVDHNGVVSPADTVMEGITIVVDEGIGHAPDTYLTDVNGSIYEPYRNWFYLVSVDSTLLPPWLSVVYGSTFVLDTVCGETDIDFLLVSNCSDVFIIQQEEICSGDSVLVEDQWLSETGVYSFALNQSGAGCDTTLDVYVNELAAPLVDGVTDWNCVELGSISLEVFGTPPYAYQWTGGIANDTTLAFYLPDGVYEVIVTDSSGCSTSDTFYIESSPPLEFEIQNTYEMMAGDSVFITILGDTAVAGNVYYWSPNTNLSCDQCSQLFAYPDSSMVYTVEVLDSNGCTYVLDVYIEVLQDTTSEISDQLFVPNVFSPNEDGINDYWRLYSRLPNAQVSEITIYDRWGTLIYSKANFALETWIGWDGTFKGKVYSPGVFAYRAHLVLGDGQRIFVKGDVTLLR